MITMREAVKSAIAFIADMYPSSTEVRLEEVELQNEDWLVTLSFLIGPMTASQLISGANSRLFKVVKVDAESGDPISLKVWDRE